MNQVLNKILAGVSVAFLILVLGLGWKCNALLDENASLATSLDTATDANTSNQDTIAAQRESLNRCIANRQTEKQRADAIQARLDAKNKENDQLIAQLKEAQNADYQNDPEYRAWSDSRVPTSVLDRLRRIKSGGADPDR